MPAHEVTSLSIGISICAEAELAAVADEIEGQLLASLRRDLAQGSNTQFGIIALDLLPAPRSPAPSAVMNSWRGSAMVANCRRSRARPSLTASTVIWSVRVLAVTLISIGSSPKSIGECFELIEREMLAGPWVIGERYTICDPYLFTLARWLEDDGVDPAPFPKVRDHRQRMSERSAVKVVLAQHLS